jgi:hypothetical protein
VEIVLDEVGRFQTAGKETLFQAARGRIIRIDRGQARELVDGGAVVFAQKWGRRNSAKLELRRTAAHECEVTISSRPIAPTSISKSKINDFSFSKMGGTTISIECE